MTLTAPDQSLQRQDDVEDIVLSVKNVSKRFCRDLKRSLFYGVQDIAGEVVGAKRQNVELRKGEFWALKDVSFDLKRGEALGLVGANGAGKTTLLRIISGLIRPDHGSVEVNGRVAPLIALGAGFNPILTGRENIYVNMSILGLSKQEIDERFEEVVEFAEIGEAIDAPVQSYSSGMAARLGFASAIFTEPEILLIDEVLAVGDIKFRAKCYRKLEDLIKKGTSFLLVSHSSHSIQTVCDSAIYLRKGELVHSGNTFEVLKRYEEDLFLIQRHQINNQLILDKSFPTTSTLIIEAVYFRNSDKQISEKVFSGQFTILCIKLFASKKIEHLSCAAIIRDASSEGECILSLNSTYDEKNIAVERPGRFEIQLIMDFCCLRPGRYLAKISISQNSFSVLDAVEAFEFIVESKNAMGDNKFYQPIQWNLVAMPN